MNEAERQAKFLDEDFGYEIPAAAELRRLSAINAELVKTLERIADQKNIHFAGDAQVVAKTALEKAKQ